MAPPASSGRCTYFESSVAGEVTALRVYLGPVELGNPARSSATCGSGSSRSGGNNLESATFSSIVAGWNEVALTTPISISANTINVVSANTNAGSTGLGAYAAGVRAVVVADVLRDDPADVAPVGLVVLVVHHLLLQRRISA